MWIFLLSCTLLVCPVRFRDTGTIMPTGKWSLQFSRVKNTCDLLVTKDWERRRVKYEQESWHATWWGPWKCKLFVLKLRNSVGCWELDGTAQMWPKATGTWPRFLPGQERKEELGEPWSNLGSENTRKKRTDDLRTTQGQVKRTD